MTLSPKLGIDLGTANVLVAVPGRGIILEEPSVVARSSDGRILAVGTSAREMLGKTPDGLEASRPLREGVIADYHLTETLLRYLFTKSLGRSRVLRPEVMISVPAGISSTERRAVIEAATKAGARRTYLIAEPIAAALGTEVPIGSAAGNLIVDIGGGTTEVALISLGGVVAHASIRTGGDDLDQAIIAHLRKAHGILIGELTAEQIKIRVGSALVTPKERLTRSHGRDLSGGLPKTISIGSNEIALAIAPDLERIIEAIGDVLERTPPELASDIIDRGVILTGGVALLPEIDRLVSERTGIPAHLGPDPLRSVARGTLIALESLDRYKSLLTGASR